MVVERRGKRQSKALNKADLQSPKFFAEVGQRSGQGQVNGTKCKFLQYRPCTVVAEEWTETDCPKRVLRLPRQYSLHTMSFKGQGQGQVRSGQVRSPKTKYRKGHVRHMFYGSFYSWNSIGTLNKWYGPPLDEFQVEVRSRSGQVRSNFEVGC